MKDLTGICCALCTPFADDGESVDEGAFRDHIDSMIDAGMHIILVCGGTGEFAYLRHAERLRLAEIAGKHIAGRAGFVVQTTAINTRDAVEYTKHAKDQGADCVLMLPPYFEGPTAEGVYWHFEQVSDSIDIPIMVYNIPVHSGFDITPEFFKRLSDGIPNVRYIKDSTADLVRIQRLVQIGAKVFNGGDPTAFHALMSGCVGCVWGGPNAMPREAVMLYELIRGGDLAKARTLWTKMFPAQYFFWTHNYNPSVKAATTLSGRRVGPCRKPAQALTHAEMVELKEALAPLGIG